MLLANQTAIVYGGADSIGSAVERAYAREDAWGSDTQSRFQRGAWVLDSLPLPIWRSVACFMRCRQISRRLPRVVEPNHPLPRADASERCSPHGGLAPWMDA